MRRFIIAMALCAAPASLSAQRIANERAGIAPSIVMMRHDTTAADSVPRPHRSRVVDAIGGGIIGGVIGGVVGVIYASEAEKNCKGDLCGLAGLAIPEFAAIGLVGGTIVGALLPPR